MDGNVTLKKTLILLKCVQSLYSELNKIKLKPVLQVLCTPKGPISHNQYSGPVKWVRIKIALNLNKQNVVEVCF